MEAAGCRKSRNHLGYEPPLDFERASSHCHRKVHRSVSYCLDVLRSGRMGAVEPQSAAGERRETSRQRMDLAGRTLPVRDENGPTQEIDLTEDRVVL